MKTVITATTAITVGVLLTACTSATGNGSATSSAPDHSASAPAARIPDGTWTRDVTTAEITKRGLHIGPDVITANYLDDGSVRLVLKTQGTRWSILVQDNAGAFEVGDQGSTRYDAEGRWVQESDSTGGSILLGWAVSDDTLTTSIPTSGDGPQPSDDERLFVEGPWRRNG